MGDPGEVCVRQLRGGDHLWFALETEHAPLQFVGAAIYDPSTRSGEPIRVEDLKAAVAGEIHQLPLRKRLLKAPWRLDRPYWVDAHDFDLDDHIDEIDLPQPADRAAFLVAITTFLEAPFDRSRPLWGMRLIRGLAGIDGVPEGGFAVLVRVHHGQFDGTTALRLLESLHTTDSEQVDKPALPATVGRIPTAPELLARAPWHAIERGLRTAIVASRLAAKIGRRPARGRNPTSRPSTPVPRTRFSSHLASSRRVFDFLEIPLDDVAAIKEHVRGATVNDVASTIVGGALRRFLQSHGELPDGPIVVLMPVSAHASGDDEQTGNRISLMTAAVHTEIGDPLERLRKGRAASTRSKQATERVGARNVADLFDVLPTNLFDLIAEPLSRSGVLDRFPLPFSGVALTNVPGPRETLYFDGARMVTLLGGTFLLDGLGLIIAVTSYDDRLIVSFTSSPEAVPDPGFLATCFQESFDELHRAVIAEPGPAPSQA